MFGKDQKTSQLKTGSSHNCRIDETIQLEVEGTSNSGQSSSSLLHCHRISKYCPWENLKADVSCAVALRLGGCLMLELQLIKSCITDCCDSNSSMKQDSKLSNIRAPLPLRCISCLTVYSEQGALLYENFYVSWQINICHAVCHACLLCYRGG